MPGSLKREPGDIDRISAWLQISGILNSASGFIKQPEASDTSADLNLEVFDTQCGSRARNAVGLAKPHISIPVKIEGKLNFIHNDS